MSPSPQNRWRQHLPLVIGGLGLIASFVLLLCSTGTNDIRTWESFAEGIDEIGIISLYERVQVFNHPPLMGYLAWFCLKLSSVLGISFPILFKLVPVLANLGSAILLMKIWLDRGEERKARWAFALYCWSPCAILIGAFHGNTDCLCIFACVACLYLLEVRKRPGLAGLALAAAINVKIIPVLIFLPLLASQRTLRDARAFTLGAACAALPFAIAWLGAGDALVRNIFQYGSNYELWGFQVLIRALGELPDVGMEAAKELARAYYYDWGRALVIGSVVLLAGYGYWRKIGPARLMAATFCLFLLFAPGFGAQYTVYLVAPILAVSLAWGMRYDLIAGTFILLVYLHFRQSGFPLRTEHTTGNPDALAPLGFATWVMVLAFVVACLREPKPLQAPSAESTVES